MAIMMMMMIIYINRWRYLMERRKDLIWMLIVEKRKQVEEKIVPHMCCFTNVDQL